MILKQFHKQVVNQRDNVIITYNDRKITYSELDSLSNRAANYFKVKIISENIVISLEEPIDFTVALLGAMKAGKTAVLLNPQLPNETRHIIMHREKYEAVINEKMIDYIKGSDISDEAAIADNLPVPFIIFTSGSTSVAKTINVYLNMMTNYNDAFYRIIEELSIKSMQLLCSQYYSFGLCNLLIGLCYGIEIQIPNEKYKKNIFANLNELKERGLDMMIWPVSYLKTISAAQKLIDMIPSNIKLIVTGGETLIIGRELINKLKNEGITLFNSYGSSETLGIFNYDVEYDDFCEDKNLIPIGDPIENVHYVLEDGELFLTFDFDNNLVKKGDKYRTGDMAVFTNNKLYLTGRADHCRKIRGYRVDMDAVERTIFSKMPVEACCVFCVRNNKELEELGLAYSASAEINIDEFKSKLSNVLSDYMIPNRYYRFDKLPVNSNGKIDRKMIEKIVLGGYAND